MKGTGEAPTSDIQGKNGFRGKTAKYITSGVEGNYCKGEVYCTVCRTKFVQSVGRLVANEPYEPPAWRKPNLGRKLDNRPIVEVWWFGRFYFNLSNRGGLLPRSCD